MVAARSVSGSAWWVSHPVWVTRMSGAKARTAGATIRVVGHEDGLVAGVGRQRDVEAGALALAGARLVGVAGAGEEEVARFVDRDGEHPRVVVEGGLDPVAVVGVEVDVGHALARLPRAAAMATAMSL